MKKQTPNPDQSELPLDYHEEREQQFAKKKATKKDDYKRKETLKDLEDEKYWN